jgi:Uma2 family endonuclease
METMSTPETVMRTEPVRPLKRVEYERLAELGYFEDEKVELLLGAVLPMTPTDPAHSYTAMHLGHRLQRLVGERAFVLVDQPFAASDISEPEPDVAVVPNVTDWAEHPRRAFLIVEVARTSLRRDKDVKAAVYAIAEVDEYWIINLVDEVVEVYRDRHNGEWRQRSTHPRGETIAMLAFPDVQLAVGEILPPIEPR